MPVKKVTKKGLRITTKKDGWRRAGRSWVGKTEVLLSDMTDAEIDLLENDPMIIVDAIDIEEAPAAE